MSRTFTDTAAVRHQVPLMVGLVGPSGGGKTFSALRLATGIQRVSGGDIYFIDTEANRSLHYADKFKFQHVPFGAPFSPLDYLAAIEHCAKKGAKTIVVDSMSHEHEGPGGVLEMHETELVRIGKGDAGNFLAWAKPKAERRRLINSILQMNINFICCFRAKEKIKMARVDGKTSPSPQGWQPIAGEEFVFEMTLNCLLLPNANGVPSWSPEEKAERQMIKLPQQFRDILKDGVVLSEEVGVKLAEWAKGGVIPAIVQPAIVQPATISDGKLKNTQATKLSSAENTDQLKAAWIETTKLQGLLTVPEFEELTKLKDEVKATFAKPAPVAAGETL